MINPKELKDSFDEYCDNIIAKDKYSENYILQMKEKMNHFYEECHQSYKAMKKVLFKTASIVDTFDKTEFMEILKSKEELKND